MEVERLEWWPDNIAKLHEHRISPREVDSILVADDWVVATQPDYPDQLRMIGPTTAGRLLTIVLAPTEEPAVWRPVTGWDAAISEIAYYRREHR